ncbi:hypothetical protein [Natrinema salinisoli]|nr:hypothetical protein [Natrinema salinisoli]
MNFNVSDGKTAEWYGTLITRTIIAASTATVVLVAAIVAGVV